MTETQDLYTFRTTAYAKKISCTSTVHNFVFRTLIMRINYRGEERWPLNVGRRFHPQLWQRMHSRGGALHGQRSHNKYGN